MAALWAVGVDYQAGVRRRQSGRPWTGPAGLPEIGLTRRLRDEYRMLGRCPEGHIMELYRAGLGPDVLTGDGLRGCRDGATVRLAGVGEIRWPLLRGARCAGRW